MTSRNQSSYSLPITRILLAFAALCLVTSLVLGFPTGGQKLQERIPPEGGVIGPFTVDEPGTVLRTEVSQSLPVGYWSSVTLALLDDNKQYLTGFGDGFWHEEGYDSEGYYWRESESAYVARITVPEPGDYYLEVSSEDNLGDAKRSGRIILVDIGFSGFSQIPHLAAGAIAGLLAIALVYLRLKGRPLEIFKEK